MKHVARRVAFVAGLVVAPFFYGRVAGGLPRINSNASTGMLAVVGILVGLGSRRGAGCTSGHGVCGVGRGSARSLVATAAFMAAAIATSFVVRFSCGRSFSLTWLMAECMQIGPQNLARKLVPIRRDLGEV
jgi:uncharacterized membrane protein YedE/YeeE